MADDPPRYMGAGFVVFSSNNIELYYYMDEPGILKTSMCQIFRYVCVLVTKLSLFYRSCTGSSRNVTVS